MEIRYVRKVGVVMDHAPCEPFPLPNNIYLEIFASYKTKVSCFLILFCLYLLHNQKFCRSFHPFYIFAPINYYVNLEI
jgi:hypothetical protein